MPAGNFGESQYFAGGFLSADVAKQIEDLLSGAVEKAVEKVDSTAAPSTSPTRSEQPAASSNPSTDKDPLILSGDAGPRGNHSYWTGPDNPGSNNPKAAPTTTAPTSGATPETAAGGAAPNIFKELFGSGAVHESLATSVISGIGASAVSGMTGSHLLGHVAGRYIRSKINEPIGDMFNGLRSRFGGEGAEAGGEMDEAKAALEAMGVDTSKMTASILGISRGVSAGGVAPSGFGLGAAGGGGGAAIPPAAGGAAAGGTGASAGMGAVAAALTDPLVMAAIVAAVGLSISNNVLASGINAGASTLGNFAKNGPNVGSAASAATQFMDPLQGLTGGWINLSIWDDALRASIHVIEDFDDAFENLARELNDYSPSVAYANSQRELRMELAKYRRGQTIGDDVGRFSNAKSQFDTALYDIMTQFYDAIAPLVADGAEAISDIAKIARDFSPIIKILASLPVAELRITLLILQSQIPWQVRLLSSILGVVDKSDDPLDSAIAKELDRLLDPKAAAKIFPGMKLPAGLI